ncbi:hypothetical protein [Pseudomonas sp. CCC2.2]|uniref:hypothetical protein n=1 Tax=Pseudomonas sp. CCC2.2 TaxID=3048605 RepID=UPI002B235F5D|nr:hypothetical protein [Pseudomonas sp. CCC2.2]MEB0149043.1 hypothetical protein [Pseudomonas sp. CCC2.2]
MKASSMNGWQRLWLVVCILIAIPLTLMCESLVPSKEGIIQRFEKELTIERNTMSNIKEAKLHPESYLEDFLGGATLQGTEARILDLETRYKSELDSLWFDKVKVRGIWSAIWAVICITLYVMGWAIGWIGRGFRPKRV